MYLNSTIRMIFITIWWLTVSGSLPVAARNNGAPFNIACNDTTVNKTAYIGETVSITCNYSQADEGSIRTFCKHDGNFSCSNIVTDEKQRGVLEVNISMLTQEDSGRYWCALERDASITCLQDFFLHVLNKDNKPKPTAETRSDTGWSLTQPEPLAPLPRGKIRNRQNDNPGSGSAKTERPDKTTRNQGGSGSGYNQEGSAGSKDPESTEGSGAGSNQQGSPVYDDTDNEGLIAGIVCGVIVVAAIIVVILFRRKIFNIQASAAEETERKTNVVQNIERNDGNHQPEEMEIQNKQSNTAFPLYSTVNPPAEQLHYASVNIHNNTSTENTIGSSTSNESVKGAAQTPADTTLYSTIAKLGE